MGSSGFENWTKAKVDEHNARVTAGKAKALGIVRRENVSNDVWKKHVDQLYTSEELRTAPPFPSHHNGGVAMVKAVEPFISLDQRESTDVQKLNKLERAYHNYLLALHLPYLGVQNITLKLADDCRFTPDFNYIDPNGRMVFVDVKGFQREDALLKIKFAARQFRWAMFVIVKKNGTGWDTEDVNP
jgi:hypothetical protein